MRPRTNRIATSSGKHAQFFKVPLKKAKYYIKVFGEKMYVSKTEIVERNLKDVCIE